MFSYHAEVSEQALNDYLPEMSYHLHNPQFLESGYKVLLLVQDSKSYLDSLL